MPDRKSADQQTETSGLRELFDRLDTIVSLLIPPIQSYAAVPKSLQEGILEMCDYEHTTEDIQKAMKKKNAHINKELSLLRSKGLIKTVSRSGRRVHVRLPVK